MRFGHAARPAKAGGSVAEGVCTGPGVGVAIGLVVGPGVGAGAALGGGGVLGEAAAVAVPGGIGDPDAGWTVGFGVSAPGAVDVLGAPEPAAMPDEPDPSPGRDRPPRSVVKVNAAPSATTRMIAAMIVGIGPDDGRAWRQCGARLIGARGNATVPDSNDRTSST